MQTVSLSIFRFNRVWDRAWVFGQMGAARLDFWRMPDVGFWKLCGSGKDEGFTPKPNTAVWAILATWPDEASARKNVGEAPVYKRWRRRADEAWTVFLSPSSARGQWSGTAPFTVQDATQGTPIAALTRATIKPRILARFWERVPNISTAIGADPNVMFKIGIGEVPWLHQVTFSIWPSAESMAEFARRDGPHAQAIKAVREGDWFAEELYARFRVVGETGQWEGRKVLSPEASERKIA